MTKYTYQAKLGKIIYIIVYIQQVFCTANSNDNDIQVSQLDSEQRKNITINYKH